MNGEPVPAAEDPILDGEPVRPWPLFGIPGSIFAFMGAAGFLGLANHFRAGPVSGAAGDFTTGMFLQWAAILAVFGFGLRRAEDDPPLLLRTEPPATVQGEVPRDRSLLQRAYLTRDIAWLMVEETGLRVRRRSRLGRPIIAAWWWSIGMSAVSLVFPLGDWLYLALFGGLLALILFDPPRRRLDRAWPWSSVEVAFETSSGVELVLREGNERESLRIDLWPAAHRRLLGLLAGRAPVHRLPSPMCSLPPLLTLGKDREKAIEEARERLSRL